MQLFPAESSRRSAFIWDDTFAASVVSAVHKYEVRGYKFLDWNEPYVFPSRRMSVGRDNTLFVDFTDVYRDALGVEAYPEELFNMLVAGIKMLSWHINNDGIPELSTDRELMHLRSVSMEHESVLSDEHVGKAFVEDYERCSSLYGDNAAVRRMLISGVLLVSTWGRNATQLL